MELDELELELIVFVVLWKNEFNDCVEFDQNISPSLNAIVRFYKLLISMLYTFIVYITFIFVVTLLSLGITVEFDESFLSYI